MAATWIRPVHTVPKCSTLQSVKKSVDYINDPAKTDDGRYVSTHLCEIGVAHHDFEMVKMKYEYLTNREQANPILAYSVRQSFMPGEITPEQALKIGEEFAMEMTQGQYAFIVATHIDREHIHNHILINAYEETYERKFSNHYNSYKDVRDISDELCEKHGLSVIENPQLGKNPYSNIEEYIAENRGRKNISNKKEIEIFMETVLQNAKPTNMEEFYGSLRTYGMEVRDSTITKGKGSRVHHAFRLPNHQKPTRMDKLPVEYREAALELRFKQYAAELEQEREERRKKTGGGFKPEVDMEIGEQFGEDADAPTEREMEIALSILQSEREAEEKERQEKRANMSKTTKPVSTAPTQKQPDKIPEKPPGKDNSPERAMSNFMNPTSKKDEQENNAENQEEKNPRFRVMQVEPTIVATFKNMIDMEKNKKAQTQERYMIWCVCHNISQTFETLDFLRRLGLDSTVKLNERMDELKEDINYLNSSINESERRLKEIKELQKYIGVYTKTRKYFDEFQRTKDPAYLKENRTAIENCQLAKDYFDSLGVDKLPKINDLKNEYAQIQTQINKQYAVKNSKWKYLNELNKARKNIDLTISNNVPRSERTEAKKAQKKQRQNRKSMRFDSR